jgi:uridine kinase
MNNPEINILDAYIRKNNQIVILILGMPCSNKCNISKMLNNDLNLNLISLNDYIKKIPTKKTINDITYTIYDHEDNYDWDGFNNEINQIKNKGVIIYGNYFYLSKINFNIDYIFFIEMNKNMCSDLMKKCKMVEDTKDIDNYLNNYLFPSYDTLKQNLKINKFYNIKKDNSAEQVYDKLFDNLMKLIELNLYGK